MPDQFTPEERSAIMARVRSSGTAPEERLHALVRGSLGPRWRIDRNRRDLPGSPDIVVPSLRLAIFMDGCFWHACPQHKSMPKNNRDYWEAKIARNVRRDRRARRALREDRWSAWRVWEHDLRASRLHVVAPRLSARLSRRVDAFYLS